MFKFGILLILHIVPEVGHCTTSQLQENIMHYYLFQVEADSGVVYNVF